MINFYWTPKKNITGSQKYGEFLIMGIFEKKINLNNIPINKVRKWISSKTEKILGVEDEIFIDYCMNQLLYKTRKSAADEELQISPNELVKNIEGFLGDKAVEFVVELWEYITKFPENNELFSRPKYNKNYNFNRSRYPRNNRHSYDILDNNNNFLTMKRPNNTYRNLDHKENIRLVHSRVSMHSTEIKRARSLSRSLSPDSYRSYGVEGYGYEIDQKKREYFNKTEKVDKSVASDKSDYKAFKASEVPPNISSSDKNKPSEYQSMDNNKIEEERLLRMRALKKFERKVPINHRSESEEILRARALEKLINKRPTN